jgi:Glycosyltransferase Family 4
MGQFARLLPEFGWDVTVITAQHDGVDAHAVDALAGRAKLLATWSPSKLIPRGLPTPKRGLGAIARTVARTAIRSVLFPDREILWAPGAIRAGARALAETPHDAVLATHGPGSNLVVGHWLARSRHLPLVVDFRDLWSTTTVANFASPVHRAAARKLEQTIVRDASRLIAVAPDMTKELVTANHLDASRGVTITNGFDSDDAARVRDTRTDSAPFRLMYTGSVNMHYDFTSLWRAVKSMADRGSIRPETCRIEFIGNLALSDVRAFGIEAFFDTKSFVPHAAVFDEFARADALLVLETPGYYARYSYAAKVFDYLLTGKPILALVEAGGNTAQLLAEAGVGYFSHPDDPQQIAAALERVIALKGAPPKRAVWTEPPLAAFDRRTLTHSLAATLDDVVATEPRGRWA